MIVMLTQILLPGRPGQFPNYERALVTAGANVRYAATDTAPSACHGLLLPGGGDLHPRHYHAEIINCQGLDEERDALELFLTAQFMAAGKPILGICRGMQILNVALGGTLHQHIEGHSAGEQGDRFHPIYTAADSVLAQLYGQHFTVNSAHHQAVERLGDGLRAVQWAGEVIEAAEHVSAPVWAVQWHPERLFEGGRVRDTVDGGALIGFFVAQCGP